MVTFRAQRNAEFVLLSTVVSEAFTGGKLTAHASFSGPLEYSVEDQ